MFARHLHVAAVIAAALAVAIARRPARSEGSKDAALVAALSKRGILASANDVVWIDAPGHLVPRSARAVVRASPTKGEPADLFLVSARLAPNGALLSVGDAFNVTETSSADESRPVVRGERVAYVAKPLIAEGRSTVHVLDLAGAPEPSSDWTALERAQNAVTNLQQTGQSKGIGKRTLAIEVEGDPTASVELMGSALVVHAKGQSTTIDLENPKAELPVWLRDESEEAAKPGNLVTWAVDRVRAIPWIGDDAMQTVKAVAFTLLDFVLRNKEKMTGDTGEKGIAADLGKSELDPPTRALPTDPDLGWPPPPLTPVVSPVLGGEGQWNPLDHDAYVRTNPGLPPAFLTTFLRTDPSRKATRVYIALWDPRQVELHMMAGTVEPKGATGEAGPGLIPRTPEVMKRVVAASNAGFQAMHGEFGMMADGVVYLPPKPYAATVAALRDGSTGFGTWPLDTSIPEGVLSYRQNMTVMVQDEKFNPYGRTWWGGTPPGWEDKTHTVRTGICLTKEGFIGYFYGADLSPDALAQAMISARCSYGLALDMNAGHSGLEFYKVAPAAELEPLAAPLQTDWQAEGDVPGMEGWKFRGRRLIRGMGLMHFPRYIKREARDYFYMTLRHVLPGPPLAQGVEWRLKGLPQHGFPYALALADTKVEGADAHVLEIDPRMVDAEPAQKGSDKTVAIVAAPSEVISRSGAGVSIWHSQGAFSIAPSAPVAGATRIATGEASGAASAAAGVSDEDGMLVYVELASPPAQPTEATGKALAELLKKRGCSQVVLFAKPLSVALGGDTDLAGRATRVPASSSAVLLSRRPGGGAKRIFEDTPIVPINVWYPLQQKRIRYFKKPEGQDASGEDP